MSEPVEYELRFSLRRLLLAMTLIGIWLAGSMTLDSPWLIWLTSVILYLLLMLSFAPSRKQR